MTRLQELENKLQELLKEAIEHPWLSFDDPMFKENNEEWRRINKEHDKYTNKWLNFYKRHRKEMISLIIEENKKNGVYWDREDWIYDAVKSIPQHMELKGQERTAKFVEDLEKLHGCVVTEDDAGYTLEVFTPYKVYLYRFNRGYGNYPITITKGYIAPGGNTYRNKIFLAKNARDMKERYHEGGDY